jgi:hypothetical protein
MVEKNQALSLLNMLEEKHKRLVKTAWNKGNLRYKLHEAQKIIYDELASLPKQPRETTLLCSRRFGKSVLVVLLAIEECLRFPKENIFIYAPSLGHGIAIVDEKMELLLQDCPPGLVRRIGSGRRWKVGKSNLIIGGFDKVNVKRNKGLQARKIFTEEACESDSDQFAYAVREVLSPLLLHSKGSMIHATTLPKDLNHSFVTRTVPSCKAANSLFIYTIGQNPLLDDEMREQAIVDSGGVHTAEYKRNYLCEFVREESTVVLPSFLRSKHVHKLTAQTFSNWIVFGDSGGTRDKTFVAVGCYVFQLAKFLILEEKVYENNTSSLIIADGIKDLLKVVPSEEVCDVCIDMPGQLLIDYRTVHGINVTLPNKSDFDSSINALEVAFSERFNSIMIDERCAFLINSCENGRFNKTRQSFERTESLGHCDAIAALMYGWRMVDKVTNPFSRLKIHSERKFERPKPQNKNFFRRV